MYIERIWLSNFRNYETVELGFGSTGINAFIGNNGQGKSNLLEAIGYASTLRSFRGAQDDVMVQVGKTSAIVRAQGKRAGRELLIESELRTSGRNKTLINRQPLRNSRELSDTFIATSFSPEDLILIKGGPSFRREYLDQICADSDLQIRQIQRDFERVIKQRNSLLKQANNKINDEIATTLDVWDAKFIEAGEPIFRARERLVHELNPYINEAYQSISGETTNTSTGIGISMVSPWRKEQGGKGLAESLIQARHTDLARAITTVGPHRDEVYLSLNGMPARTHASQGEQRTLALALRLASYIYLQEKIGDTPILLLDDVFSELDESRTNALLRHLKEGQTFLTTTHSIDRVDQTTTFHVADGGVRWSGDN